MIRSLRIICRLGPEIASLPIDASAMASEAEQAQKKALEARMAAMQTAPDSLTAEVHGRAAATGMAVSDATPRYGTFMVGKTDAPDKLSTQRPNPFVAMIGDYAAIMGNGRGDNRVEFGGRASNPHCRAGGHMLGVPSGLQRQF